MPDPASLRQEYTLHSLDTGDVEACPLRQFHRWFEQAVAAGIHEPNAMTLATAGADGRPNARTVLLKGLDGEGFTFFTSYISRKGRELAQNPHAALSFLWKELQRQVQVRGRVERVSREESAAYFASRPYGSQIGAHASTQSSEIASRGELEGRFAAVRERWAEGAVPLPETWGGYRVVPEEMEFWQGRPSRLHDRLLYTRTAEGWRLARLGP